MILKLQSLVLFNSLFLYPCYDIIRIKSIFPDSENYFDRTNSIEDRNIIRLLKKLSPYSKSSNKILIKRVVPHGSPITNLEYNHEYKILYKPLFRIHAPKLTGNGIKDKKKEGILTLLSKLNSNDYKDLKEPNSEHFDLKEDSTEELLEPIQSNDKNEINLKALNNIHKALKFIDLKKKNLKTYNNIIYLLKNILRSPEKSGEDNDPLASGKTETDFDELNVDKKKSKGWIPHYPYWNYWTYRKPIHQDVCPGMQVKSGNMCIWIPEH